MIRYIFFSLFFLIIGIIPAKAQNDFTEIEKTALEELKQTNTPGAAIAIIKGDKVIFSRGFSVSNLFKPLGMKNTTFTDRGDDFSTFLGTPRFW